MLIDRLYLRNYRVYDELDLALPQGLVGVYGPNGAGKSTLLEAVLWALWGRSRTTKDEVRSAGAHGDCVAEVTFEHEGHIYTVRRTLSGAASTVRAQAECDGLGVAEGVRETARYVHSVLGMDDAAFRASVFAEQKQIAAFSSQGPAERRKLVLSLLGVTPLDGARDRARADARQATSEHEHLRGMLPDVAALEVCAADADAKASALEVAADDEERAAGTARARLVAAQEVFGRLDLVRQEHEKLVVEGKAARAELEGVTGAIASLQAELDQLAGAEAAVQRLGPQAAKLARAEQSALLLGALAAAAKQLAARPEPPAVPVPDDAALQEASAAAMAAGATLGAAQAKAEVARAQLEQARQAVALSADLSSQADCPLCGQALGNAFAQVQAHRSADLGAAEKALLRAEKDLTQSQAEAQEAQRRLHAATGALEKARAAYSQWERAGSARRAAAERVESALSELAAHDPARAGQLGPQPSAERAVAALAEAQAELADARGAAEELNRARGRLERRPQAEQALAEAREHKDRAEAAVADLRAKVKDLGFDATALGQAQESVRQAETAAHAAEQRARAVRLEATSARADAAGDARRLADARAQHAKLADLQSASVHLSRAAELLNAFRNSVVASVGPRLAVDAAGLFAELTDNEYDRLEVDADTYGLKICDGGVSYDLERFSGSEVDLANLSMRVAISEHISLLAGGTVGLLVLDEVFGPLDDERRARMLLALERLRARFRQILVVTHSTEIKDQLPAAIEVVKKPGRRAVARVADPWA